MTFAISVTTQKRVCYKEVYIEVTSLRRYETILILYDFQFVTVIHCMENSGLTVDIVMPTPILSQLRSDNHITTADIHPAPVSPPRAAQQMPSEDDVAVPQICTDIRHCDRLVGRHVSANGFSTSGLCHWSN